MSGVPNQGLIGLPQPTLSPSSPLLSTPISTHSHTLSLFLSRPLFHFFVHTKKLSKSTQTFILSRFCKLVTPLSSLSTSRPPTQASSKPQLSSHAHYSMSPSHSAISTASLHRSGRLSNGHQGVRFSSSSAGSRLASATSSKVAPSDDGLDDSPVASSTVVIKNGTDAAVCFTASSHSASSGDSVYTSCPSSPLQAASTIKTGKANDTSHSHQGNGIATGGSRKAGRASRRPLAVILPPTSAPLSSSPRTGGDAAAAAYTSSTVAAKEPAVVVEVGLAKSQRRAEREKARADKENAGAGAAGDAAKGKGKRARYSSSSAESQSASKSRVKHTRKVSLPSSAQRRTSLRVRAASFRVRPLPSHRDSTGSSASEVSESSLCKAVSPSLPGSSASDVSADFVKAVAQAPGVNQVSATRAPIAAPSQASIARDRNQSASSSQGGSKSKSGTRKGKSFRVAGF